MVEASRKGRAHRTSHRVTPAPSIFTQPGDVDEQWLMFLDGDFGSN
jgi:hypothetical protein